MEKEQIISQLTESRAALMAVAAMMNAEKWETAVFPHDDQSTWTAADLLRHLAEAERSMLRLMINIREGGPGASPEFDLSRWNASRVAKSQHKTPDDLLHDLTLYRQELRQFMDSLQPEDWQKTGRHGSGEMMRIADICALIAAHEAQHTAEIAAVVR